MELPDLLPPSEPTKHRPETWQGNTGCLGRRNPASEGSPESQPSSCSSACPDPPQPCGTACMVASRPEAYQVPNRGVAILSPGLPGLSSWH